VVGQDAIFASNTSSIPIHEIASASSRPESVVGMHYFSPVPKLPLLEIIATNKNPEWVLGTVFEAGRAQGKTPIIVGDAAGFYTTRIVSLYMNEALLMLEEGVSPQAIDRAMRDFGFPVGPITLLDEVGIDVGAKINKVLREPFAARGITLSNRGEALMEAGILGRKSGKGFYLYEATSGTRKGEKEVNPELDRFVGTARRDATPTEIQERLALIMVSEAILCLQEGVLASPRDGDVGAVFGLGFPPFLGGPFWYADRLGAGLLLGRLEAFEREYGVRFMPPMLLLEHAEKGLRFYS
jgi:3-hydroxyacyl-CoA dehydrogenase/enoyl-CoA hydratase/3-hydroxybutyryl-CoA epimerase